MKKNDRPNVLLITTDQQRFDTVRKLGNPYILTPHIDTMCEQGIAYTRCYATAPICVAARVTMFSGQHPRRHGVTGNGSTEALDTLPSLPHALTQNGYQTRIFGKAHFNPLRATHGFEHAEITRDYYREMEAKGIRPSNHGLGQNETVPAISTVHENDSLTNWIARRSCNFLECRDERRPFFIWTSFSKPHPPFDPCFNYWSLYQNREVPEPVYGDWSRSPDRIPPEFSPQSLTFGGRNNSHAQTLDARRAYYALITQIDYNIGLILGRLRELGELENTWIVFTSDHGEMLGDHNMWAKMMFCEQSCHVPLIVRIPARHGDRAALGGTVCKTPVGHEDLYPTILRLCGIEPPDGHTLDGCAIYPDIQTAQEPPDERIFAGTDPGGACHWVMRFPWSYQYEERSGFELLFNMKNDRQQIHNLAGSDEHARNIAEMRKQMGEYLRSIGKPDSACLSLSKGVREEPGGSRPDSQRIDPRELRAMHSWPGYHTVRDDNDIMH